MDLSNLRPADGSKQSDNFRRGRGHGSGNGKTAGKGHKGQKARSGATRPGFEGGQMPLYRRIPKRGFTNRNSKTIVAINLGALERFEDGATVSVDTLIESGIVKNMSDKGQFSLDYSKYQLLNPGDFAMNHMDLLTGWVDISQYSGVTSPDYRVFCALHPQEIDINYYKHVFQTCYRCKIFYGLGQGVSGLGRWRLPAEIFLNFTLPVPPLQEQIEIGEILDKKCSQIDDMISEKQSLIYDLGIYKKSLVFEVVTGKRRVV